MVSLYLSLFSHQCNQFFTNFIFYMKFVFQNKGMHQRTCDLRAWRTQDFTQLRLTSPSQCVGVQVCTWVWAWLSSLYIYLSIFLLMHACIHTYIHTYLHTCIYACMRTYIHTDTLTCIHIYVHTACIPTYTLTYFLSDQTHTFMHIFTFTRALTLSHTEN